MTETLFTLADYEALPEDFPAQLIEGVLVREPPPRYGHQATTAVVRHELTTLVGPLRVPEHPSAVRVDEHNAYHPDLVVLAAALRAEATYVGVPILVVEQLSPRTRRHDREVKTPRLIELGVAEVWLLDDAKRVVEVHTRDGHRVYREADRAASQAVPGFGLVPAELFDVLP